MAERRTSSILLIVPFFGSLPPWSELYFRSCAANPTVNWLLVSDHVFDQGSLPPNVRSRRRRRSAPTPGILSSTERSRSRPRRVR